MKLMTYKNPSVVGVGLGILLVVGGVCEAKWRGPDLHAPVDRLITNTKEFVKKNPKDAQGYYILGRLHSMAFAKGAIEVSLYSNQADKEHGLPSFPSFAPIRTERESDKEALTSAALKHFQESVRNYRLATQLKPTNSEEWDARRGLYYLGYGWMLEQGHLLGKKVSLPPGGKPTWREQALQAYRLAFRFAEKSESENAPMHGLNVVTQEAAEGIERLHRGRSLSVQEKSEIAKMQQTVKEILAKPRPITPIIFPLTMKRTLAQLLSEKAVKFDLAGDDIKRQWPWVKPDVGILVWDPGQTGRVTSGRQLFGSATWWMFWEDGYQPLAALDDDRDGGLTGKELNGIAVWCDANSNGVSDPGEVIPAGKFGVQRIATRPEGKRDGVLANESGLLLRNGTNLPTFDWTPIGKPVQIR